MNGTELALRKELAVMHLRIARAELALLRAQPVREMTTITTAVDLATGVLSRHRFGRWGEYLLICLRVTRAVLRLHQAL